MSQNADERREQIEKHEAETPPKEAVERKERSIARLKAMGVPTIAHLPFIEDSSEAKVPSKEEMVHRAIAVCLTALKGEGLGQEMLERAVRHYGAKKFFSPKETAFIYDPDPSDRDRIQFSWRYEDLWVLLWALGYVDKLETPATVCDVAKAIGMIHQRDTAQLLEDAKPRSVQEILDEADFIYRAHWAVVSARVQKAAGPKDLQGGVVMERHYTLNWLIGYMEQSWDDISTDT